MDIGFTEEQELLRDTARNFLDGECPAKLVRRMMETKPPSRRILAAAGRICAAGIQLHGGIGMTWEHDLHLYLKRAKADEVAFGDATWHRERVASLIGE